MSQHPPEGSPSGWEKPGQAAPAPGHGGTSTTPGPASPTPGYQVPPVNTAPQYGPYGPPHGGYGPPPGGYGAPQEPGYGEGPPAPPPPGYFGAPPPGGYYRPPAEQQVPNYLWQNIVLLVTSVVLIVLIAWPSAIAGAVFASRVRGRQAVGDVQGALRASKIAKRMSIITLLLLILSIVVTVYLINSGWYSEQFGTVDNGDGDTF